MPQKLKSKIIRLFPSLIWIRVIKSLDIRPTVQNDNLTYTPLQASKVQEGDFSAAGAPEAEAGEAEAAGEIVIVRGGTGDDRHHLAIEGGRERHPRPEDDHDRQNGDGDSRSEDGGQ